MNKCIKYSRSVVLLSVVFVLVLIASVISMTHLQHATKPPQLFRPDTNVEMLLDLMANYTTQGIPKLPSNYKPVGYFLRYRFMYFYYSFCFVIWMLLCIFRCSSVYLITALGVSH